MNGAAERSGIRLPYIVFGLIGLLLLVLFVGSILVLGATRFAFTAGGGDVIEVRALPLAPADAPVADEYQPLLLADGPGEFQGQLMNDPAVVIESIDFVATAIGPVSDREVYVFKSRIDGKAAICAGEFSANGGSFGCDDGPGLEPSIGGSSSQSGNGPIVEQMSVSGLDPDSAWVRFTFDSGYAIVSEAQRGFASIEWVGNGDNVAVVQSYSADGELLWSDDPSFG